MHSHDALSILLSTMLLPLPAFAQQSIAATQAGSSMRVEVTPQGAFVRTEHAPVADHGASLIPAPALGSLVWTHSDGGQAWIGENVAIGNFGGEVFTEYTLNSEAAALLSSYDTNPPTPFWTDGSALGSEDHHVDSAEATDTHISLHTFDQATPNAQTVLSKYSTGSGGAPDWTYTFGPPTNGGTNCGISRDGQAIVALITNIATWDVEIAVFSPSSNTPLSYTLIPVGTNNWVRGFDLSADGSTLYFSAGITAYVFDIATTSIVGGANIGSSFDSHAISGDGSVFAFGTFNTLHVYKKVGGVYTNVFNRTVGGSNYVAFIDISDDSSTIAYAFTYYSTYLTVRVEALDVATQTVTMTDVATGTGSNQNVVSGVSISADGSRFAVGVWGDQGGLVDEMRLYSKTQNAPLATVNLPGSVFGIAISADGTKMAGASKAVHANSIGNGGRIDLFDANGTGPFPSFCAGDGIDPNVQTACPCFNYGSPGHGCGNSVHNGGALLTATGTTSPDTVQLTLQSIPATAGSIYLQGDSVFSTGAVFGDGIRCAAGNLVRMGLKVDTDGDGATTFGPASGDPQVSVAGSTLSGFTYTYQTYYRNPNPSWCPPATFNISQALAITW